MIPIAGLDRQTARQIVGVFTDIDDTLTEHGRLVPQAYSALWDLKRAGLRVIPVSGRPAGWCDCLVRQWPVDAVIGENGAIAYALLDGVQKAFVHPSIKEKSTAILSTIRSAVLHEIAGARVAKDQPFRLYDLAIDFAEEQPHLGFDAAEKIKRIFERYGAQAKISSIHVNGWMGSYDKLAMAKETVRWLWQENLEERRESYLFVGDSPNDEPMFAFFPNACGVANVREFEQRLRNLPRFVATQKGGYGFAEICVELLNKRAG